MEFITPTMHELSETIRAVKHAQKVIDTVEKKGVYVERVGNTGIKLEITKGSILHITYQAKLANYREILATYEINRKMPTAQPAPSQVTLSKAPPTPVPISNEELKAKIEANKAELLEMRRTKQREYNRKHYLKVKAQKEAQKNN